MINLEKLIEDKAARAEELQKELKELKQREMEIEAELDNINYLFTSLEEANEDSEETEPLLPKADMLDF